MSDEHDYSQRYEQHPKAHTWVVVSFHVLLCFAALAAHQATLGDAAIGAETPNRSCRGAHRSFANFTIPRNAVTSSTFHLLL
jgi:hypothetical protein